jgi:acetylornithine deacetylase/succinyl-diaminopimelate desuccinylase-like protein
MTAADRVLAAVDALADEAVAFTQDLIRVPTVNPPGEHYADCAALIGRTLSACALDVEYHEAVGRPEHTGAHPRVNVIGTRRGRAPRPLVHLNGHFDVVPPGAGWTKDPFGAAIEDGRVYGRGACDMKAGIAAARHATLNVNGISGGQPVDGIQTPCVADGCRAVFDRRFLIEEGFDEARAEIVELLERLAADVSGFRYELRDRLVVHPTRTPEGSPVVSALDRALHRVLGRSGGLVASPGTYDQKHFARIAGVPHCVAYGPGILDLAHQPDEYCEIADLVSATKVIALAVLELTGTVVPA